MKIVKLSRKLVNDRYRLFQIRPKFIKEEDQLKISENQPDGPRPAHKSLVLSFVPAAASAEVGSVLRLLLQVVTNTVR